MDGDYYRDPQLVNVKQIKSVQVQIRCLYHTPTPKAQGPSLERRQKDSKGWRESMPAANPVFSVYGSAIHMNSQSHVCMDETSPRPSIDTGGIIEVLPLSEELLATVGF